MSNEQSLAFYYALRDRFDFNDFDTYYKLLRYIATTPPPHAKMFMELYIDHYRKALSKGLMKMAHDIAFNIAELPGLRNKKIEKELVELLAIAPKCDQVYFLNAIGDS